MQSQESSSCSTLMIKYVLKGQSCLLCSVWVISKDSFVALPVFLHVPFACFFLEREKTTRMKRMKRKRMKRKKMRRRMRKIKMPTPDGALGDTELPGFTPLRHVSGTWLRAGKRGSLEGVTFQVPDASPSGSSRIRAWVSHVCFSPSPPLSLLFLG